MLGAVMFGLGRGGGGGMLAWDWSQPNKTPLTKHLQISEITIEKVHGDNNVAMYSMHTLDPMKRRSFGTCSFAFASVSILLIWFSSYKFTLIPMHTGNWSPSKNLLFWREKNVLWKWNDKAKVEKYFVSTSKRSVKTLLVILSISYNVP